jgi:putative ABC transport system permease protein
MDYRSRTKTLSGLAAYANWSASLAGDGVTERLQGARLSANAFDVLGVSPAAGRLLRESDDSPDAAPVAVVSYRLWQRQLGGAPTVVGRGVRINAESYVIVGVLPRHFPFPLRDVDVVVPLAPDRDPLRHVRTSVNFLRFIGRASPGASREQAQAELSAICRALRQQFPVEYAQKDAVRAVSLHEAMVGDLRPSMLVLLAAVLVVLGTALANLVSLVLVRAGERRAELAVRVALGASRPQLVRQLLVEALLLALDASGVGALFAAAAVKAAVPFVPASVPRLGEVAVDARVLAFATLVGAAVTVLLTLAPLGVVLRTRAGDALRLQSRGAVGDRWSGRVRQALVAAEISAALVLLLATGALLGSVRRLQEVPLGFRPDAVFQARVSIPPAYRSPDDGARFYDTLSQRLVGLPGVETVGLVSIAPLSGLLSTVPFAVDGEASRESQRPSVNLRVITPGYLEAVGTRVVAGRTFEETDRADTPPVALVSRALAARFLGETPLGRRVLIDDNSTGPRPVEVVGVVEDVRQIALDGPPTLDLYIPLRQVHPDGVGFLRSNQFWMVRTRTAPASFRESFVRELRTLDEDAAVSGTGSMRQYVDAWLGPRRFALGLLGAFALTGVFLTVGGVYGLVSYAVSQRRREIGLRVALGATEGDVRRLVLCQAARLGLAGVVLGSALVAGLRPVAASLAQDASLPPPLALGAAALLFALVTVAAWLPARRAARVPPTLALEEE